MVRQNSVDLDASGASLGRMTNPARMLGSGTGLDLMKLSNPLGFDSAYSSDLFSAVRIDQPAEGTQIVNSGIEAHTLTIWGSGTRIFDSELAGKRGGDATIPAGISTISPARADWKFSLKPQRGHNFAFYIDPRHFEHIFQDDDSAGRSPELMVTAAVEDPFFIIMMDAYLREMREGQAYSAVALESIALQVSLHLARNYSTLVDRDSEDAPLQIEKRRLDRAKSYIHENLESPITLTEIASAACLSQYHFVRCFKAAEGLTPYQYVIRQRLERARSLVCETQTSLAEIAAACGFSSQQHFTDSFRKKFNTSPGAMRQDRQK